MFVSQEVLLNPAATYKHPSKSKSRSREKSKGVVAKTAVTKDPDVVTNYVNSIADSKGFVKKSTLIAILKAFGRYKPTGDAERVIRRLMNKDGLIPKATLIEFFTQENRYERGKLTEEDYGRVFDSFAREGQLKFEILMKNADELANRIGEREAKLMVRIFGKGKDHINRTDFVEALTRGHRSASKPRSKDKRR